MGSSLIARPRFLPLPSFIVIFPAILLLLLLVSSSFFSFLFCLICGLLVFPFLFVDFPLSLLLNIFFFSSFFSTFFSIFFSVFFFCFFSFFVFNDSLLSLLENKDNNSSLT